MKAPREVEDPTWKLPQTIRTTIPCCGHVARFPLMRTATRVYRRTCQGPCRTVWQAVVRPLRVVLGGERAMNLVDWTAVGSAPRRKEKS